MYYYRKIDVGWEMEISGTIVLRDDHEISILVSLSICATLNSLGYDSSCGHSSGSDLILLCLCSCLFSQLAPTLKGWKSPFYQRIFLYWAVVSRVFYELNSICTIACVFTVWRSNLTPKLMLSECNSALSFAQLCSRALCL